MCKFCKLETKSNLDSFAYGNVREGFHLMKELYGEKIFLNYSNRGSLEVKYCPICGEYLLNISVERKE
jgi:hypothetical protein